MKTFQALDWRKLAPLIILFTGLICYYNSFSAPFIFDDFPSIVNNPHIRRLWPPTEAMSRPFWFEKTMVPVMARRPITSVTLAVNYAFGGLDPWGYHAFNLGVHLLAAFILFGIVRRTLSAPRLSRRYGTSSVSLALAAALIWSLHPLQTESVTYIIQRSESLMGLFYLLTLYAWIRGWYAWAILSCALGMGSKEVMMTAPLAVLIYDRIFLSSSWGELFRKRGWWFAGLAATWIILTALLYQKYSAAVEFHAYGSSLLYAATQTKVLLYYLKLCVWPYPQCLDWAWPLVSHPAKVWPFMVITGALLLAAVWALIRKPPLGFLGIWFFLILGPTSSFHPLPHVIFEHRLYLPLAAVSIGFVVLTSELKSRSLTIWIWILAVLALGCLTIRRNQDYQTALTIWRDTVQKSPRNARAHDNLGVALAELGRLDEAIAQELEAIRLKPNFAEAHQHLGTMKSEQGQSDEAITHFQKAIEYRPDLASAYRNIGLELVKQGKTEEAYGFFNQGLAINPYMEITWRAPEQAGEFLQKENN